MQKKLRIFISSPADVIIERQIALQVIRRLALRYRNLVELKPILWEREPLLASEHFQDALDPTDSDIMICILWSRLGSSLPDKFSIPDGRTGITGTEWEFEQALEGKKNNGKPDILVYKKTAELVAQLENEKQIIQAIEQKKQLEYFFNKHFYNQDKDHTYKRAFFEFEASDIFEQQLEKHLSSLIEKVQEQQNLFSHPITWHQGSPFRGLQAFEQKHHDVFFGRSHAISQVIKQYKAQIDNHNPFLIIMGMSGSGKSSLLNAGLIPLIKTPRVVQYDVGEIRIVKTRPDQCDHPDGPLAGLCQQLLIHVPELVEQGLDSKTFEQQIKDDSSELKNTLSILVQTIAKKQNLHKKVQVRIQIIIDQFEELFTNKHFNRQQCITFCDGLKSLTQTHMIWCLATLRSDFLHVAEGTSIIDMMREKGQYTLQPPNIAEIEQIINQPASAAGVSFERNKQDDTLDVLLRESTRQQVGALPLLEFCLDELFEHRDKEKRLLTYSAYEQMGGLEGAISQRAEQALMTLENAININSALPNVFHALISIEPDNHEISYSRYLPATFFDKNSDEFQIIQCLLNARLLIASGNYEYSSIRIAHEALISHWQRVKDWMIKDIEFLKWYARIEIDEKQWQAEGCIKARLLPKGKPLSDAEDFISKRRSDLHPDIQYYINESLRHTRHKKKITRGIVIGIFVMLFSLTLWAMIQTEKAQQQAEIATNQSRLAEENKNRAEQALKEANHNLGLIFNEKAKQASKEKNFQHAAIYNAAAYLKVNTEHKKQIVLDFNNQSRNPATPIFIISGMSELSKQEAQNGINTFSKNSEGHTLSVSTMSLSQSFLASGSMDKSIKLWELKSGRLLKTLKGHEGVISHIRISPDEKILISSSTDYTTKIWDIKTGTIRKTISKKDENSLAREIYITEDDLKLIMVLSDGSTEIYDLKTGKQLRRFSSNKLNFNQSAISNDGEIIASVSLDKGINIWDVKSGELLKTLSGHGENIIHIQICLSSNGEILASGAEDNTIKIWNTKTGELLRTLEGHNDSISSLDISPDNLLLASGSEDTSIKLWNVQTGKIIQTIKGHDKRIIKIKFNPEGNLLGSSADDKNIKLWDISNKQLLQTISDKNKKLFSVSVNHDSQLLATASEDNSTKLWDIKSGLLLHEFVGHNDTIYSTDISPNGLFLASSSKDKLIKIWDLNKKELLYTLGGHDKSVNVIKFSPDSLSLASASKDTTIKLWDVNTGQLKQSINTKTKALTDISFYPDSLTIVGSFKDQTIKIWDINSGKLIKEFNKDFGSGSIFSISPDGMLFSKSNFKGSSLGTSINIMNYKTGQMLETLVGHKKGIRDMLFSPDNTILVSCSRDKSIKLWDIHNGLLLQTLTGHTAGVREIHVSSDNHLLISLSRDNTIKIWDMSLLNKNRDQFLYPEQYLLEQENHFQLKLDGLSLKSDLFYKKSSNDTNSFENWPRNHPFHWLDKAKLGDIEAMYQLATVYEYKKKPDAAFKWLRLASNKGHKQASKRLSFIKQWQVYDSKRN